MSYLNPEMIPKILVYLSEEDLEEIQSCICMASGEYIGTDDEKRIYTILQDALDLHKKEGK